MVRFVLLITYFLLNGLANCSLASPSNCPPVKALEEVLRKYHYAPPLLDDARSKIIFQQSFHLLDPEGLYFTQRNLEDLAQFQYRLDDDIMNESCDFVQELQKLYQHQLLLTYSVLNSLLEEPQDLKEKDTIWFSYQSFNDFAPDQEGLKKRWKKWIKYQTLQQIILNTEEKSLDPESLLAKEPEYRKAAGQKAVCKIQKKLSLSSGLEHQVASVFMNAITSTYDPHSNYFSTAEKQSFEASLSKESKSYGFGLEEDTYGNIKISNLTPGGPAWKSNELHKGDVLLQLKMAGKEVKDLHCFSAHEIQQKLLSSPEDLLSITLRKKDGQVRTVSLVKEKLTVEENRIKSFVLKGNKNIGYLSLPGFYTEWEEENPLGCANDVAREILILKKENIEGLILDLRFNGGGSLKEALDLAGIFINEGPLAISHGKAEKPALLKDRNRGTVYDGPLLVLVNGQSASASEIIAAALQDYHRALIVGSPTFGKASSQVLIPLRQGSPNLTTFSSEVGRPKNFVKVTIEKFYRITGKTHQSQGVLPDISLPDILEHLPIREANFPTALPADEIQKTVYYNPLNALPLTELKERSSTRVSTNTSFKKIIVTAKELEEISSTGKAMELSLQAFLETNQTETTSEGKTAETADPVFSIVNTGNSDHLLQLDSTPQLLNEETMRSLSEDIYVTEAFLILNDFITLTNN
jgi:carboxyl-terminal processing protease